jgi:hypothetical protein
MFLMHPGSGSGSGSKVVRGIDPDPDPDWIGIKEGKNDSKNWKKLINFL